MSEWKNGKCSVYEDRHGNIRCGACCGLLCCNDTGDMPNNCPFCGAPLDYGMAASENNQQEASSPRLEARIDRMMEGDFKTKAYVSVIIEGAFAIHGIRVIEDDNGRFIAMPQDSYKKSGETRDSDAFHAITDKARKTLIEVINDAYEQKLKEQTEQKEALSIPH